MTTDNNIHKIVAVGMFDGVHAGHRYLFQQLKAEADERRLHPMVITFTNHPLATIAPDKAPKLLSTSEEKAQLIAAEGVEPIVIPFNDALRNTSARSFMQMLVEQYSADAMLLGFNNRFGHNAPKNFTDYCALAKEVGLQIILAEELHTDGPTISSSVIRQHLMQGNVVAARQLLLRPYSITGSITSGKQIGRTIGFPTANLTTNDAQKIIPQEGVYAAMATTHTGKEVQALVNIGRRPTVESSTDSVPITIEAHLIDFHANLYNTSLTLHFIERLRGERKFPNLQLLQSAINADLVAARKILQ